MSENKTQNEENNQNIIYPTDISAYSAVYTCFLIFP